MRLVLIEWIDSHSGSRWQDLDNIKAANGPLHCRSVGWVVAENKKYITLVSSISGEKNENIMLCGTGGITIPKCCITRRLSVK